MYLMLKESHAIYQSLFPFEIFITFTKTLGTVSQLQGMGQRRITMQGWILSCQFSHVGFPSPKEEPSGQQAVD